MMTSVIPPRYLLIFFLTTLAISANVNGESTKIHTNEPGVFFSKGFVHVARSLYKRNLNNTKKIKDRISNLAALAVVSRKVCKNKEESESIGAIFAIDPDNKWAKKFVDEASRQECKEEHLKNPPTGYIDTWGDMYAIRQIAADEAKMLTQPMQFYTLNSCSGSAPWCGAYILAIGTIKKDTAKDFIRHFEKDPSDKIAFHSPGGDLAVGLELGREIRKRKLHTFVGKNDGDLPGDYSGVFVAQKEDLSVRLHFESQIIENPICLSACAYAFLGGTARHVSSSGRYGVHQFDAVTDINENIAQTITGLIGLYLAEMDINRDLLQLALWTDPKEMWILDHKQLESLGVITQRIFSNPSWRLTATDDGKIVAQISAVDEDHTDREITMLIYREGRSFTAIISNPIQEKLMEYTNGCISEMKPYGKSKPTITITVDKKQVNIPFELKQDLYANNSSKILHHFVNLDRDLVELMAKTEQPIQLNYRPSNACSSFGYSVNNMSTIKQKSTLMAILRN